MIYSLKLLLKERCQQGPSYVAFLTVPTTGMGEQGESNTLYTLENLLLSIIQISNQQNTANSVEDTF